MNQLENLYACALCNMSFAVPKSLEKHVQTVHTVPKQSESTKKSEISNEILNDEAISDPESEEDSENEFKIEDCDIKLLTDHLNNSFCCQYCDKKFSQKCNLNRHEMIHTGEKPYSCNCCNLKFRHRSTLKVHERTHTTQRPYSCKNCDKSFATQHFLNVHANR